LTSRVIMGQRPGQRPTQGDEKSLRPATTLYRTVALSFLSSRADDLACGEVMKPMNRG
jgi:hypothetical protein